MMDPNKIGYLGGDYIYLVEDRSAVEFLRRWPELLSFHRTEKQLQKMNNHGALEKCSNRATGCKRRKMYLDKTNLPYNYVTEKSGSRKY
jgi:hypothetical protein